MKKLIIYAMPLGLIAADAAAALPSVWGRMMTEDIGYATARSDGAPIVLVQHRSGGGGRAQINRTNVNRTNVNRQNFNANNFQRNVTVNRNVTVAGGHYGPNWGGVAAGVAVGAGVTAVAAAAANAASYPPPPPYPYDPYYQQGY